MLIWFQSNGEETSLSNTVMLIDLPAKSSPMDTPLFKKGITDSIVDTNINSNYVNLYDSIKYYFVDFEFL